MLASALIVFREVFEAGLVIGIVLSATRGVRGSGVAVALGVVVGLLGASLVALFAGAIGEAFDGSGQEVLNGCILLVAAAMLGWHTVWMASHGRRLAADMRDLGRDVAEGGRTLLALSVVVGVAVLREGAEVVLFLYGLLAGGDGLAALAGGAMIGVAGGAAVSALLYLGLLAVPTKRLFAVTNAMLILLAGGLASQGVGFLISAGWLPSMGDAMWDTSRVLSEKGWVGSSLHALVGYTSRPAGLQLLVEAGVLAALAVGTWYATPGGGKLRTAVRA